LLQATILGGEDFIGADVPRNAGKRLAQLGDILVDEDTGGVNY